MSDLQFCAARAAAVQQFLDLSTAWAMKTEHEARGDLTFAVPGSWDYDQASDLLAVTRRTRATVDALRAELDVITTRADLPRG